jgi:hypothetical protein
VSDINTINKENRIIGEDEIAYISVRKSDGKGPLKTPTGRWENNIKMYLKEIECSPTLDLFGSE